MTLYLLRSLPLFCTVSASNYQGLSLLASRQLTSKNNATLDCTLGPSNCSTCSYWSQCWIAQEIGEWMFPEEPPYCPEGTTYLSGGCFYCGCTYEHHNAGECEAAGGAWCGLTTSLTTSTTTTTTLSPLKGDGRLFERFPGDAACRGSSPQDNSPNYYEVLQDVGSVEACREHCLQRLPQCKGIEYSSGRCEIWTRKNGIFNTAPLAGFICERFGWPVVRLNDDFGLNSECRGDHWDDVSSQYYERFDYFVKSLEDCKARCIAAPVCFGIEFDYDSGRNTCMVWKRPIRERMYEKGHQCLRFPDPRGWEIVESASGSNGPCRGLSPGDNSANHYHVMNTARWTTIGDCRSMCVRNLRYYPCVGIEFSQERCEIWTRSEGIYHAAEGLPSFTCERWGWPVKELRLMSPVSACRGSSSKDNSADYYEVHAATHSIGDCTARCAASPVCFGVEFAPQSGRCEVWLRPIRATAPVPGHECWAWVIQGS
eukprot:TRINITY_DN50169_c0_g1_i1.p1 TRINITY_DN50169_c0_g1~~TRINITY_DN50169_c0_g1_i1.p1  ORF type:complete len:484 (-),score=62.53 TRINITY_DN50169_c0_g1_i1:31-1482(-)